MPVMSANFSCVRFPSRRSCFILCPTLFLIADFSIDEGYFGAYTCLYEIRNICRFLLNLADIVIWFIPLVALGEVFSWRLKDDRERQVEMKRTAWSKVLSLGVTASLISFTPMAALASPEDDAEEVIGAIEALGPIGGSSSIGDAISGSDLLLQSLSSVDLLSVRDFSDCSSSEWYADAVTYVSDKGLITGYSNGAFGPYDNVTRGQLATILWRMEGQPKVNSAGFSDVKSGDFYYSAALWAQKNGVIKGYGDGTFGGDREITRQEAAVMLANYAKYKGLDISSDKAALKKISGWQETESWAMDSLGWAVDKGLMSGKNTSSGAYLDASGTTWRSAMAKMIMVLDRDVLGNPAPDPRPEPTPEPSETQEQKEQRVLAMFQQTLDDSGMSAQGARVGIVSDKTYGRIYFLGIPLNMTLSEVRSGYKYSSDVRNSLNKLASTIRETSGSMYALSIQEGANLHVDACMFATGNNPIYAAQDGKTTLPLSYTLR